MSVGINYVELMGNLGLDPIFVQKNDFSVCNIRIATGSAYTDKQTGEKVEKTEWHNVVLYGRQAEIVNEYLKKGSKLLIKGHLRTRKWQDKKNGEDRYTVEIVANELHMLGSPGGKEQPDTNTYNQKQEKSMNIDQQDNGPTQYYDDIPF